MTGRTLPLDPLLLGVGGGSLQLSRSPMPSSSSSASASASSSGSGRSGSSDSGRSGIELPVDRASAHLIGGVGLAVSLLLAAVSLYRLGRFLACYGWRVGEALRCVSLDAWAWQTMHRALHWLISLGVALGVGWFGYGWGTDVLPSSCLFS